MSKKNGSSPALKNGNGGRKVKMFEFKLNLNPKRILVWLVILFLFVPFIVSLIQFRGVEEEVGLSQVLVDIKNEKIEKVTVLGEAMKVEYKEGKKVLTHKEANESFTEVLDRAGIDPTKVKYETKTQSWGTSLVDVLGTILPIVLIGVFFMFLMRQAKGAQDTIFSFGRSKAKRFAKGKQQVTFKDVGGIDEAKKELEEIVDFLKNPKKYLKVGARTPKGALLVGASGTGKTLLARAIAGEANVPFFSMAGSEFMEMLVGVGSARMRDLFETAKKSAPAIVFIDEIDAIGRMRGFTTLGGHGEQEQTLNQLLVEMDGFTPNDNVVVVAASVTGDTPVLIRKDRKVALLPMGEVIDEYYQQDQADRVIKVDDIEVLGLMPKWGSGGMKNNLYFGGSQFVRPEGVFRHKVDSVYEIKFLGGVIRATGNHSVFVRTNRGIESKEVSQLKPGELLVQLPMKVNRTNEGKTELRAHIFEGKIPERIKVYQLTEEQQDWQQKFLFVHEHVGSMSQAAMAEEIGVSQTAVSGWLRGRSTGPRMLSREYFKHDLPDYVDVTPGLCRLLGYYTAEGYARKEIDFCFSVEEKEYIEDVMALMEEIFGLLPDQVRRVTHGAINLVYQSKPIAMLFKRFCGGGADGKYVPEFLFETGFKYYQEYLRGCVRGDGYIDSRGRGELTSVSERLILELHWLSAMHGIKTYVRDWVVPAGRVIGTGKPLPETHAWRLGWGKMMDPLRSDIDRLRAPMWRAKVLSVKRRSYDGYVYDFVGCDGEAFFGGKTPVLLHNTNRSDVLDPALLRPGRFDRIITLDLPDLEEREKILRIHAQGKQFGAGFDWKKVAKRTVGFSGADLENMLNEAAILAAREDREKVSMDDVEEAATKVKLGPAKKRLQNDLEREMTAYHEAGHAVVGHLLPNTDPVHRVSIVSRGMALGFTLMPPDRDKYQQTRSELMDKMAVLLGGRAAEELVFNELTGGAASDIEGVTRIARQMVVGFGMSELGPINFGPQWETTEWGRAMFEPGSVSPDMQAKVDGEVGRLVEIAYKMAAETLKKNRPKLSKVAKRLIEVETIDGEEFEKLMETKKARVGEKK